MTGFSLARSYPETASSLLHEFGKRLSRTSASNIFPVSSPTIVNAPRIDPAWARCAETTQTIVFTPSSSTCARAAHR